MTTAGLKPRLRNWVDYRSRLYVPTRRIRFQLALRALERFAGNRSLRLLDAGASEALMSELVALRHPEWSIDAVDIDEEVLALGAASMRKRGIENVRVFQADLTKPLGDRVYDAVLALECLTLIPDDHAALQSMATALKGGGLFLTHVPDRNWQPVLPHSHPIWEGEKRHGYSSEEIVAALEQAGLSVVSVTPTSRGMARLGRELGERVARSSLKVRAAWYPLSLSMARLDRWGMTWGAVGGYFVEARR